MALGFIFRVKLSLNYCLHQIDKESSDKIIRRKYLFLQNIASHIPSNNLPGI